MSHYVPPTLHRYFESDRSTQSRGRLLCEFFVEGRWDDWDWKIRFEEERRAFGECIDEGDVWYTLKYLDSPPVYDGKFIKHFVCECLITREPPKP